MKTGFLDLDKLNNKDPKIKYGFAKELLRISLESPGLLYNHFSLFENLLNSKNNILKWTAIDIIGRLSSVDKENKIDKVIKILFEFLHGGNLITTNHAIFSLGLIAQNKTDYKEKIIEELLSISKDNFETETCKEIAVGKVILALGSFIEDIKDKPRAIDFIKQAQHCERNATKKKANQLLDKIAKPDSTKK